MLKAVLLTILAGGVVVHCDEKHYICEGTYKVDSVQKCDNPEQYKFDISITKRKINRTHDGFTFTCDLPEDVTYNFGLTADVYKKCDGGYKYSNSYNEPSFCRIMNQLLPVEFGKVLASAGYDPPNCPLPKGLFNLVDYVIDNRNIPKQTKCGKSKVVMYGLQGITKIACVTAYLTVSPLEDDEADDED